MEQKVKVIVGGVALFILGGFSVYLITSRPDADIPASAAQPAQASSVADVVTSTAAPDTETADSGTNAESFYAAAEARREQQLADKAESDRLAKLRAVKERSVECKFWKQQQKTSSAAAKIEEKIIQYCTLQSTSSNASSSSDTTGEQVLSSATQ